MNADSGRPIRPLIGKQFPTADRPILQRKKGDTSLWIFLGLFAISCTIFLVPQFHLENFFHVKHNRTIDIIQHIIFYFLFSFILFKLLSFQRKNLSFFLFIFTFSAFFELLQALFYESDFSYRDTASNFFGIGLAFLTYKYFSHKRKSKLKKQMKNRKSEV
jgi:glycopeptide antibiotics resistance protein